MTIGNENKNNLGITNEDKISSLIWDEADYTWNEATGTWELSGLHIAEENKNNLTITNENKI